MQTIENCLAGCSGARQVLNLPYLRQMLVSYVDYRDVAEAAAIALTTDILDYGTLRVKRAGNDQSH